MNEKVAVVISTYNGSKYIIEQLDSIVKQTRKVDKIYVFDDKSSDRTVFLAKRYLNSCQIPFEIIVNKINKGWKKNFFDGINYVKEELIFLADQDDIWFTSKVEKMIEIMIYNSNINVLCSNYELYFSEKSSSEKIAEEKRLCKDGNLMKIPLRDKYFYIRYPGCSFLIRKSFFDANSYLWNEEMPHDSFLWKIALLSESLYSINIPLFKWRRHSTNVSNRATVSKNIRLNEINSNLEFMYKIQKKYKNELSKQALEFCKLRKEAFANKSIVAWLKIFTHYRNFYVSYKSCLGDLYYLIGLGK